MWGQMMNDNTKAVLTFIHNWLTSNLVTVDLSKLGDLDRFIKSSFDSLNVESLADLNKAQYKIWLSEVLQEIRDVTSLQMVEMKDVIEELNDYNNYVYSQIYAINQATIPISYTDLSRATGETIRDVFKRTPIQMTDSMRKALNSSRAAHLGRIDLGDAVSKKIRRMATDFDALSNTLASQVQNRSHSMTVKQDYIILTVKDDNRTEICKGLHGKVFKWNSGVLPPFHHRCRSGIKPVEIQLSYDSVNELLALNPQFKDVWKHLKTKERADLDWIRKNMDESLMIGKRLSSR